MKKLTSKDLGRRLTEEENAELKKMRIAISGKDAIYKELGVSPRYAQYVFYENPKIKIKSIQIINKFISLVNSI